MDETDNDVYVDQLREVFDSCDVNKNGTLNRRELTELCKKLQLEDQVDNLLGELLGDAQDGQVDFETFKEGFVIVLSADMDSIGNITDTEEDHSVADILDNQGVRPVSPKYVKGQKRYGRRSRPDFDLDYSADFSEIDTEPISHRGSKRESKMRSKRDSVEEKIISEKSSKRERFKEARTLSFADSVSEMDEDNGVFMQDDPVDKLDNVPEINIESGSKTSASPKNETFEAEGQLNASMGQFEIPSPTDEDQVRAIWEEVGVGTDGFLNLQELALVCEHIGMEDMDQEELQNLYCKLDQDDDGKVGFHEFLEGLFRHDSTRAPTTPLPTTLTATQKVKLRMAITGNSMEESMHRTTTPSLLTFQGSKLLSVLDADNSGYVTQDSLTEHWEQQGIENTSEVLKALEVDTEAGKINISDLSMALEHVLLTTGDSNGIYQAALTSYQSELKHLKNQLDASIDENNKLKMDVAELNQRGTKLAAEVDDRHAHLEKSNEVKLRETEKRYQDKITTLQTEIDKERQMMTSQAARQKQKLEEEIDRLKAEDSLLREKVTLIQKENLRMEKDIGEFSERLVVLKKVNQKLQKEVDGFQELEARLAEWESSRANMSKEQQDYYDQQIREYKQQNREMQDRLDEVHQELAITKQQSIEKKVRRKGSRLRDVNKPNRIGSVLSDYTKPVVVRRRQSSSENESDLEDTSSGTRRQLPVALRSTGDGGSTEGEDPKMDLERAKFEAEIDELKEKHSREIHEIRSNSERERRDIETQFKIEITELEDNFEKEREEIMNDFDKEKEILHGDLIKEMEDKLRKLRIDLKEKFDKEKEVIEEKHDKELSNRVKEVKEDLRKEKIELENLLKLEKSEIGEDLLKERNTSEEKLMKLRQELERKYSEDLEKLKEQFVKEKSEILKDYERRIAQLEIELKKSEERYVIEKEQLISNMQRDQEEYKELAEFDKAELSNSFFEEKEELIEKHQREKESLEREWLERVQKQSADLEEKYARDLHMKGEDIKHETMERVHHELKDEIQREYADKMRQVKEAFDIEKTSLEMQNEVLSDKLRQANVAKEEAVVAMNLKTQQSAQSFDQTKAKSLEEELEKLKEELKQSNKKLTESQITVTVLESQHMRELQRLRNKQDLAAQGEVGQLRTKLIEKEVQLKEAEKRILENSVEKEKIEEKVKEECEKDLRKVKQSKHDLEKKYKKKSKLLDEYVRQLKEMLTKSTKNNTLVKDLYMENTKLQQALYTTEERQKTAEKNSYELMEKNKAYYRILKKVCPAAL
ncbi:ninein-like protein isoform X2 [Anneissia japonica]|nr:ninein-like protein isoform X2 [Anneissia japonica]XP_033123413.1 ninein-like protein isoform X2 [Anneissia japonica]